MRVFVYGGIQIYGHRYVLPQLLLKSEGLHIQNRNAYIIQLHCNM
jgi:hypothetical protein